MQFIKLNKKINVGEFTKGKFFGGYTTNNKGIQYYQIDNCQQELIFSVIPERFRHKCYIHQMNINSNIPPHTDSWVKASINFYVKTVPCITKFYNGYENLGERLHKNQTDGKIYKEDDLELASSFIAENNDVYLLDVSVPHSVQSIEKTEVDRVALVLQSYVYTFSEMYDMLVETGYINGL